MKTTERNTETALAPQDEAARADAGMVFLVGMLVAGALAIAATLTLGTPSAAETTPVTTVGAAAR